MAAEGGVNDMRRRQGVSAAHERYLPSVIRQDAQKRSGLMTVWRRHRKYGNLSFAGLRSCCRDVSAAKAPALMSAAAAASAAAASAPAGERIVGFEREAHIGKIDAYAADLIPQALRGTEGKASFLDDLVVLIGFVKRKPQMGAAATAGRKINTHGGFGFVREERFKLLAGAFAEFQHETLRRSVL